MKSNISIFGCLRPSLIGDIVCSTIFLNYLEKIYPNSFKCAYIDKKCQQIIPFLINHPLIDKIQISDMSDRITKKDIELINKFDIVFNPFPHLTRLDYYNYHHITKELFMMNEILSTKERINPNQWDILSDEEKKPKLYQWFDVGKQSKSIAIWPFSGYKKSDSISVDLRSPRKEWWNNLIKMFSDYKIMQFGFPSSDLLDNENVVDCRNLSLFDAIKISLGCDLVVGTDSGSQWLIGSYGHPQIILYTNYNIDHYTNVDAFCPINYKNNSICFYGIDKDINKINQEEVFYKTKDIIKD